MGLKRMASALSASVFMRPARIRPKPGRNVLAGRARPRTDKAEKPRTGALESEGGASQDDSEINGLDPERE